jgi:site-specific DNA-methyltransferase (adenine-specific)
MYNWIRLWLLDEDKKEVDSSLDDAHGLTNYLEFMREVMQSMHGLLRDDGVAVFVIGDVEKKGQEPVNLAREVWEHCAKPVGFKLKTILEDQIRDNTKVTKIWAKTKGNATKIDRCLIVYKEEYKELTQKVVW